MPRNAIAHLGALDMVYQGIIEAHRRAIEETDDPDPAPRTSLSLSRLN